MYVACHINGTWGSKEVTRLKLSYDGGKPQREGPSFWGGVDPSRLHVLKKKHIISWIFHFTLLRVIQVIKLKEKNNLIQPSPLLIKNTKEIRIC